MVGSTGAPNHGNEPVKPLVKSFACRNCGASVTIRYPGATMSAVCSGCNSVIDVTDPNYKIVSTFYAHTTRQPLMPLGKRGKLKGKTWEVIGFMVRVDDSTGKTYMWDEYLLFNPYYGYRWLMVDNGHWSFVRTIKRKPEVNRREASVNERDYKLFNKGVAKVHFVIGEFYWRVIVGSQVRTTDYINPPETLSCEQDDNEVVWSICEYIAAQEIKQAFNIPAMPLKIGIAPNQPSQAAANWHKCKLWWLVFLGILTCGQIALAGTSPNENVLSQSFTFLPNSKVSDTTSPVFTLNKAIGNVRIDLDAPVDNSWLWVSGEMVNNDDGTSYPFERTVEFYSGTDSDGYWSEGSRSSSLNISAVPGGKYYLNLDTESGDFKFVNPSSFNLSVHRGVPMYANYFWSLFWISLVPVGAWAMARSEEVSRWSDSAYSPYMSSS